MRSAAPNFAASNIGWNPNQTGVMLPELQKRGVTGLVIAPTMVWDGAPNVTAQQARKFRSQVEDAGLKVVGMQSLTYGLKEAALSGDQASRNRLVERLKGQANLAGYLGATSLIFGSPGLRQGEVNRDEAVDVFARVATTAADNGAKINIEPLSGYGVKFIRTTMDGVKFVRGVREAADRPEGVGLHLDAASIAGQEHNWYADIASAQALVGIESFDASAPDLAPLTAHPEVQHVEMGALLHGARVGGFTGFVSLEMRPPEGVADPVAAHLTEVDYMVANYTSPNQ